MHKMNLYTTGHGAKIDSRHALRLLEDEPLRRNVYVKLIATKFDVGERASQMRLKEFIAEGLVVVEGSPRMVYITEAGRKFRDGWRRGGNAVRATVARTPRNAYSKRSQLRRLDRIPNRRLAGLPESSPPYMVLSVDKIGVPIHEEWREVYQDGWYAVPIVVGMRWPRKYETEVVVAALDPTDLDEHGRPAYFQVWGRWEPDEEAEQGVSQNPAT
jgi:hypothetical protein